MTAELLLGLQVGQKVYTDDYLGVEGRIQAGDDNFLIIKWEDGKTTRLDRHNRIMVDFIARGLRLTPGVERKPGRVSAGRKRKK